MKRGKKWVFLGFIMGLPLLLVIAFIFAAAFNLFHAHEHCMKAAGLGLATYAREHYGNFPSDTNGFPNALLQLVKGDYCNIGEVTGPGDDGSAFKEALSRGKPIPEQRCSRIYVQGLSEHSNPQIAILWDKRSTPGGDHFRRPWGAPLREVCLVDGSMKFIPEQGWVAFSSNQIELLVREGMAKETARHYYEIN